MPSLRILTAQTEQHYAAAEHFVAPYEQHCCPLMQKIVARKENLFLIVQASSPGKAKLCGAFHFSQGGTLLPCLPHRSRELAECLRQFFQDKAIFCITGKSDYVTFLNKLLTDNEGHELIDTRFYFLMEHEYLLHHSVPAPFVLEQCEPSGAGALFPLHLAYLMEEVRNPLSEPDPVEEREKLQKTMKSQHVVAIKLNSIAVAKAQTNARGLHYVQIGGVYTEKQYRRRGLASILVSDIAEWAAREGKKTVLFVNKHNTPALHSYENAGFTIQDSFTISYYG